MVDNIPWVVVAAAAAKLLVTNAYSQSPCQTESTHNYILILLCAYSWAHKSWRQTVEQYLYDFNKSKNKFLFFLHWTIYEENLEKWKTCLKDKSGHSDGYLICALTQLAFLIKYDIVAKMQNGFLECNVFNSFPLTL